ncbi:MAG: transposase [Chitinophagaceae bacterium]
MSGKYQNKYRIASARLSSWDYCSNVGYFITICTANREHYFGQIINGIIQLSEQGSMADHCWSQIPNHFSFAVLGEWVIMPNHIHGIIVINKPRNDNDLPGVETGHALSLQTSDDSQPQKPHPRFRNPGKNSISSMVGSFKSAVTKYCNENKLPFGWQTRFHDHIIRDNDEFERIKHYIINNPASWEKDKLFK